MLLLCFCTVACSDWPGSYPPVTPPDPVGEKGWAITAATEPMEADGPVKMDITWKQGDQIKVFNADHPDGLVYELLASDAGKTVGRFLGDTLTGDGPFYAVYPASLAVGSFPDISLVMPAVQPFESGMEYAHLAAAKGKRLDALHFYNMGGFLEVTVKNAEKVKAVNLYATDGGFLHGTVGVDFQVNPPTLVLPSARTESAFLSWETGRIGRSSLDHGSRRFHIFLPAGALTGRFQVEVVDADGKAMLHTAPAGESNRIERSWISPLPAFGFVPQCKESFLLSTVEAGAGTGAGVTDKWVSRARFTRQSGQYARIENESERTVRIQDWEAGYALSLTIPKDISLDESVAATVKVQGRLEGLDNGTTTLRVIKQFGGRTWLLDEAIGNGFIIQ
jgi:hypothetical protein